MPGELTPPRWEALHMALFPSLAANQDASMLPCPVLGGQLTVGLDAFLAHASRSRYDWKFGAPVYKWWSSREI
jgi:hypothetical protein